MAYLSFSLSQLLVLPLLLVALDGSASPPSFWWTATEKRFQKYGSRTSPISPCSVSIVAEGALEDTSGMVDSGLVCWTCARGDGRGVWRGGGRRGMMYKIPWSQMNVLWWMPIRSVEGLFPLYQCGRSSLYWTHRLKVREAKVVLMLVPPKASNWFKERVRVYWSRAQKNECRA